jgi:hypothetical protein
MYKYKYTYIDITHLYITQSHTWPLAFKLIKFILLLVADPVLISIPYNSLLFTTLEDTFS